MNSLRRKELRALSSRGAGVGLWPFHRPSLGRGLFKPLQTERCILRLGGIRDTIAYCEEAGRYQIAQWMLNFPSPFPVELGRQRFRASWQNALSDRAISLVAIERATGQLVGGVALNNIQVLPEPELAYWVRQSRWREGFAREICTAMIDFAFNVRSELRLQASVLAGNESSVGLLQRLGFQPFGIETTFAEPYAPTVGMALEDLVSHQQNTTISLVKIELNCWRLDRETWLQLKR